MKITICGSSTFVKEMREAERYLTEKGLKVFTPEPLVTEEEYSTKYGREELLKMKPFFTKRHFKKIEKSDSVLIMNYEKRGIKGYFGSNTLIELAVAFYLDKRIFLLNPINENHPHFEELAGIESIVLNGDLNRLI